MCSINRYSFIFNAVAGVVLVALLASCGQNESDGKGDTNFDSGDQSNSNAAVTVADAKQFTAAGMDALGVNENGKGMRVGEHPASVELMDMHGKPYALNSAWAEKPALIVFYRGGWCPYCNGQVRELSEAYPQFSNAGVQPVLISVDEPDKSAMVQAKYNIPFPVLSDPSLAAHNAFNVVLEVDDETQAQYKEYGIDLQQWSGQDHGAIAIASAFIIDTRGHVVLSHAPSDFKTRPTAEQLLGLIGNLEL